MYTEIRCPFLFSLFLVLGLARMCFCERALNQFGLTDHTICIHTNLT